MTDHQHDFDILDARLEHDTAEIERSFNPFSGAIKRTQMTIHRVVRKCSCGLEDRGPWERCDCEAP